MSLKDELGNQGNWLFRWRSYLPLVVVPLFVVAVATMRWPLGSPSFHKFWEVFCLVVSFAGLAIRVKTVGHALRGTSGRNTKAQRAEALSTTGVYSVVRHPLYLGNYLIGLGAVLVPFEFWFFSLYTLLYWLYYERIMMAEERFLVSMFGDSFEEWAKQTPAFIPRMSQWIPPEYPFSFKTVLRREYTALLLIVILHSAIEVAEFLVIEHRFSFDPAWMAFLTFGIVSYCLLRTLKRRTNLFEVAGR